MPLSLDQAFGLHEQALKLLGARAQILAENIANADTPNYKARDIDFAAALASAQSEHAGSAVTARHPRHIVINAEGGVAGEVMYRTPLQAALDGNTVDSQVEKGAFLRNAVLYQASLKFLDSDIRGLLSAIKGD